MCVTNETNFVSLRSDAVLSVWRTDMIEIPHAHVGHKIGAASSMQGSDAQVQLATRAQPKP